MCWDPLTEEAMAHMKGLKKNLLAEAEKTNGSVL